VAIIGTWWLHVSLAASSLELTPMFRYDYTWPLTQVSLTAIGVAVSTAVFGNLIDLSIREEKP
jgi:hypothetical protein